MGEKAVYYSRQGARKPLPPFRAEVPMHRGRCNTVFSYRPGFGWCAGNSGHLNHETASPRSAHGHAVDLSKRVS